MCKNYASLDFVLDDEKYFTLSAPQMPGNESFYSSDPSSAPPSIKLKFKKKFEPKVMLYIAISPRGISKPYFQKGGLAVNQKIYEEECLKKKLIPFIKKCHSDGKYVFWPDKASSHYAKKTIEFLNKESIPFVPKDHNPTNLPQCRPIEDFFGHLASIVYKNGWRAQNIEELEKKIKKSLTKIDKNAVQKHFSDIRTMLRKCADNGPYSQIH